MSVDAEACEGCGESLAGRAHYVVRGPAGTEGRCLRCALLYRPLWIRSGTVSLLVGTLMTALNHGEALLATMPSASLAWQLPVAYAVPFLVAGYGGIMNARRPVRIPGWSSSDLDQR